MAKITDPDNLNRGTEVVFNTTALTIQLVVAGTLSTDGVALRCVYSFCREQWKSQADLIPYPFPLEPIDGPGGTQFLLQKGWTWLDTTTTGLLKDGGWALVDIGGTTLEEWMNITGLISFDDEVNDAAFYKNNVTYIDFTLPGKPNQAVQIYANGSYDYRGAFKAYIREYGKALGGYDLVVAQNITALTYKQYAIPLGNAVDIYVVDDYATAGAITGIAVDYGASTITISENVTAQNIYDYTSWWLVQSGNEEYDQFFSTFDGNNYNLSSGWELHLSSVISGGISIAGNVFLDSSQDLTNVVISGDLHIATGVDSVLSFNNVTVTGLVYNDSPANTVTINLTGSATASNAGTGNGQVDIQVPVISLTVEGIIDGAELRIYDDNVGGSNYGTELAGIEANVGTTFTYPHAGVTNAVIIQMLYDGYEEVIVPTSLGSVSQTVTLFPKVDINK